MSSSVATLDTELGGEPLSFLDIFVVNTPDEVKSRIFFANVSIFLLILVEGKEIKRKSRQSIH